MITYVDQLKDEAALVITSDQVIVYQGQIREKPEDEAQAREFLRSYEHHPAEAIVGVAVTNTKTGTVIGYRPALVMDIDGTIYLQGRE